MSEQRVWLTQDAAGIAVAKVAAFRELVAAEVRRHGSDDKAVQKALLEVVFGLTHLEVELQVELSRPVEPRNETRAEVPVRQPHGPVGEQTGAWQTGHADHVERNRGQWLR